MSDYGINKKQICFDSITKLHADLKIRLHYDEIKIKEFFNALIRAYLEKDENIMKFVEEFKESKGVSKTRSSKAKKASEKEKDTATAFGLDENDIEDIFDILQKEHPDL